MNEMLTQPQEKATWLKVKNRTPATVRALEQVENWSLWSGNEMKHWSPKVEKNEEHSGTQKVEVSKTKMNIYNA